MNIHEKRGGGKKEVERGMIKRKRKRKRKRKKKKYFRCNINFFLFLNLFVEFFLPLFVQLSFFFYLLFILREEILATRHLKIDLSRFYFEI